MSQLNINNQNQRPTVHTEMFEEQPPLNYPKTKAKKWEDKYKRATFYVQNDTMAEIERYAGSEKGEKTRIINEALQDWLKKQR